MHHIKAVECISVVGRALLNADFILVQFCSFVVLGVCLLSQWGSPHESVNLNSSGLMCISEVQIESDCVHTGNHHSELKPALRVDVSYCAYAVTEASWRWALCIEKPSRAHSRLRDELIQTDFIWFYLNFRSADEFRLTLPRGEPHYLHQLSDKNSVSL